MTGEWRLQKSGNLLYKRAFWLYLPIYRFYKAVSDRRERALMRRLVRPGDFVVDVGANIGTSTLFLSKLVAKTGQVHAFEPDPLNFSRLQRLTRHASNITIRNVAVGRASGKSRLFLSSDLNVDHRMFCEPEEARENVEVEVVCLDSEFGDMPISLLKIDVQGFEAEVLYGAERILVRKTPPLILFEYWPWALSKAGTEGIELLDWLKRLGLHVSHLETLEPSGMESGPSKERKSAYCNLIAGERSMVVKSLGH